MHATAGRDGHLLEVETTVDGVTAETFAGSYNGVGDFETKAGLGGTVDYQYGSDPDQVTGLSVSAGSDPGVGAGAVQYDAAGRMTSGAGLVVGYDGRGLTTSVASGTGSAVFQYTPDGSLESEVVNGETVWEMDGGLVRVVVHANGTESWRESVGSVAMVTSRWDGTTVTGGVTYLYRGGLGSVEAFTDLGGSALGALSYTAFGRLRSETDWGTLAPGESIAGSYGTRQGFTGGQDLASLGVVVLGARVYDPALGRWLSPDPAGMSAGPYVYAGDDPETRTDPSGAFSVGSLMQIVTLTVMAYGTMGMGEAMFGTSALGLTESGAMSGFMTGYMASGCNFRDGVMGAVDGAAMGYLGGLTYAPGAAGMVEKGLLEGSVGGLTTAGAGGSFVGGFLGAFSGALLEGLPTGSLAQDTLDLAVVATVGGTASKLGGGSFENGAVSAAFQFMFNTLQHGSITQILHSRPQKGQIYVTPKQAAEILNAQLRAGMTRYTPAQMTLNDRAHAQLILAAYAYAENEFRVVKILLHGDVAMSGSGDPLDFAKGVITGTVKIFLDSGGSSHSVRIIFGRSEIIGTSVKTRVQHAVEYRSFYEHWSTSALQGPGG
ncbi:MAG: RHS repeat-associated core domain-containing protein [Gammaproteobacteria bacterium]